MKTTLRNIIPVLSVSFLFLVTSCEKTDTDPCQTVETSTCTLDGTQQYNLIVDSIHTIGKGRAYFLGSSGNNLIINFLTNKIIQNNSLTTAGKEVAFTLIYDGVTYRCNPTSGTYGTYASVYTNYDDWKETFNFTGISNSGKKIQVSGSFTYLRTGDCYTGGGWSFGI